MDYTTANFSVQIKLLVNMYLNTYFFPLKEHLKTNPQLIPNIPGYLVNPEKIIFYLGQTHLAVEYVGPEHATEIFSDDFDTPCYNFTESSQNIVERIIGFKYDSTSALSLPLPELLPGMLIPTNAGFDKLMELGWNIDAHSGFISFNCGCPFVPEGQPSLLRDCFFFNADSSGLVTRHIKWLDFYPIKRGKEPNDILSYCIKFKDPQIHFQTAFQNYWSNPTDAFQRKLSLLNRFIEQWGSKSNTEPSITNFLAKKDHQFILNARFSAPNVYSELTCEWQSQNKPDIQPDFFIVQPDGFADILEFKLPEIGKNNMVGKANRETFAAWLQSYISQTRVYASYFEDPNNRDWFTKEYGFKVFKPTRWLIVGRRHDFELEYLKELEADYNNLKIMTYDDLVDGAMAQIYIMNE